jgi:hypothetical protein
VTQSAEDPGPQPPPLRSIHTGNFPALLHELGISLLVSTYQAGKLVLVRPDGDGLNTHFLNGGAALDWFFARLSGTAKDKLTNVLAGEVITSV